MVQTLRFGFVDYCAEVLMLGISKNGKELKTRYTPNSINILPTTRFIMVITLSVIKRFNSYAMAHFIKSMVNTVKSMHNKNVTCSIFLLWLTATFTGMSQ